LPLNLFNRTLPALLLLSLSGPLYAQQSSYDITVNRYIAQFKWIAVREMQQYGIPASITLAQGIIESNAGQSDLAVKANNHFGIKCQKEWTGPTFHKDDDKPNECFRKYDDPLDSYRDHSLFLTTRDRYKSLFSLPHDDYRAWARGLKTAGYATNPAYADLLIKTIERFSLQQYDSESPLTQSPGLPCTQTLTTDTVGFLYFAPGPGGKKVFLNNDVMLVVADSGETLAAIGRAFEIRPEKLAQYNDLPAGGKICEGQIIYLSKKQKKGRAETHVVRQGQSLWEISQVHAIRLKNLAKRNHLTLSAKPAPGTLLKLR
jgi:LysM repeat protein